MATAETLGRVGWGCLIVGQIVMIATSILRQSSDAKESAFKRSIMHTVCLLGTVITALLFAILYHGAWRQYADSMDTLQSGATSVRPAELGTIMAWTTRELSWATLALIACGVAQIVAALCSAGHGSGSHQVAHFDLTF